MVIFKPKSREFEGDLKIKLCGKRLYPTKSVKYLCVKIDTNLSWQYHVNDLSIKLNRANTLLFKVKKYVSLRILRSIYFAILTRAYPTTVLYSTNYNLQKKTVRLINFQPRNFHTSPLFKQYLISKFQDKIC